MGSSLNLVVSRVQNRDTTPDRGNDYLVRQAHPLAPKSLPAYIIRQRHLRNEMRNIPSRDSVSLRPPLCLTVPIRRNRPRGPIPLRRPIGQKRRPHDQDLAQRPRRGHALSGLPSLREEILPVPVVHPRRAVTARQYAFHVELVGVRLDEEPPVEDLHREREPVVRGPRRACRGDDDEFGLDVWRAA